MKGSLSYFLSNNEQIKLMKILRPVANSSEAGQPLTPGANANKLRPYIRLFIKSWAASLILNRTLLKQRTRLNSLRIATVLVSAAGSFRIFYSKFSKSAISGAVSGIILALGLPSEAAVYLTLYFATKLGEWGVNYASLRHWLDWLPHQVGSWMLIPIAYSQLFYTFFAHPERSPSSFKRFITRFSNGALVPKYLGIGEPRLPDPSVMCTDSVAKSIFRTLKQGSPAFRSPILFKTYEPSSASTAIQSMTSLSVLNPPIMGFLERLVSAHPGNSTVIGALMHPGTDNGREFWIQTLVKNLQYSVRILVPLYGARAYFGHKNIKTELVTALRTALAYSLMFTSSLSGIPLSQYWLGPQASPQLTLRLLGFLSGFSAILINNSGRTQFLYMVRLALATTVPKSAQRALSVAFLPLVLGLAALVIENKADVVSEAYYSRVLNWLQAGQ